MDSTREFISAAINFGIEWLGTDVGRQFAAAPLWGACMAGNLQLVKCLAEAFRFTVDNDSAVIGQALIEACRSGNLDIVTWLKDRYSLTADDACEALEQSCCVFGRLDMVRCLLASFDFPEYAIDKVLAAYDDGEAARDNDEIVNALEAVLSGKPSY